MPEVVTQTTPADARSVRVAVYATVAVLAVAGLAHRSLMAQIAGATGEPLKLAQPLATLPMRLGPWQGQDAPVDPEVRRIAGEDDFLNRQYENGQARRSVGLYVGYIGRPRSRMGHRPDVCYITHGYEQISEEPLTVTIAGGQAIPALLYEFRSPEIAGPRQLVLTFYSINGDYVNSVAQANGYNVRRTGPGGKRSSYVARFQIAMQASGDRANDLAVMSSFASDVIEPLAAMMPQAGRE